MTIQLEREVLNNQDYRTEGNKCHGTREFYKCGEWGLQINRGREATQGRIKICRLYGDNFVRCNFFC